MEIERLNWDSEFFGREIGKVTINNEMDFTPSSFRDQAIAENYDLIYVFKFLKMLSSKDCLMADLELVDIQITMSMQFEKEKYLSFPYDLRTELTETEKEECYKIAEQTSLVSRFYSEKTIGPIKTTELYKKWIDNTLNKSFLDGLFIEKRLDLVTGIHLIKTDSINGIGYCSLIGVNSNYKRHGLGKCLWNQSFGYWANEKEISHCLVPFSIQNTQSFNFHLKMGFNKVEEIKYIYHFRNQFKDDTL
jgi:dTDP-4-amino-4,6-dideoxy-D-galactose acyltransferase